MDEIVGERGLTRGEVEEVGFNIGVPLERIQVY